MKIQIHPSSLILPAANMHFQLSLIIPAVLSSCPACDKRPHFAHGIANGKLRRYKGDAREVCYLMDIPFVIG
jgi:hypothetical protein